MSMFSFVGRNWARGAGNTARNMGQRVTAAGAPGGSSGSRPLGMGPFSHGAPVGGAPRAPSGRRGSRPMAGGNTPRGSGAQQLELDFSAPRATSAAQSGPTQLQLPGLEGRSTSLAPSANTPAAQGQTNLRRWGRTAGIGGAAAAGGMWAANSGSGSSMGNQSLYQQPPMNMGGF